MNCISSTAIEHLQNYFDERVVDCFFLFHMFEEIAVAERTELQFAIVKFVQIQVTRVE